MKCILGLILFAYSMVAIADYTYHAGYRGHLITYDRETHTVIIYVPTEDFKGWEKNVYFVNEDNIVDPGNPTIDEFVKSVLN